jgi:hypothetical protein
VCWSDLAEPSGPGVAFNFPLWVAEVEQLAKARLMFRSVGQFGTDPFAFICSSIFFASPPFAATVVRSLTGEVARGQ